MVFGWELSLTLELILWVGLVAFFAFFFYVLFFQPARFIKSKTNFLEDYEPAWWNKKYILWTVFILVVIMNIAPAFATSTLAFFFKGLHMPGSLFDVMAGLVSNHPILLFLWAAINASVASFFILVVLMSTMTHSYRRAWLAKHFNMALIIITLFIFTVQGIGIVLSLKFLKRSIVM